MNIYLRIQRFKLTRSYKLENKDQCTTNVSWVILVLYASIIMTPSFGVPQSTHYNDVISHTQTRQASAGRQHVCNTRNFSTFTSNVTVLVTLFPPSSAASKRTRSPVISSIKHTDKFFEHDSRVMIGDRDNKTSPTKGYQKTTYAQKGIKGSYEGWSQRPT